MLKAALNIVSRSPFFIRAFNWEYWNFHLIYFPLYPLFIWMGIKAKNPFFFMAANPGMCDDTLLTESKNRTYDMIPVEYRPATLFFKHGTTVSQACDLLISHQIDFPLVIKPNVGARGRAVKILYSRTQLTEAMVAFNIDFIIQPFIDYPNEAGIFFYRMPGKRAGRVTGIVKKEFMTVIGDGIRTCYELAHQNPRYILQLNSLKKLHPQLLQMVLPAGKEQILMPYGNHSRGCLFKDDSEKIDLRLTYLINRISDNIAGFNYGRLDIRYYSWEDLLQGKNFSIIELNGAASEPTHIYDPKHSLFFAWREIISHWESLFKISVANNKKGVPYPELKEGWQRLKNTLSYEGALNKMKL